VRRWAAKTSWLLFKAAAMRLLAHHAIHADRLVVAAGILARLPELAAWDVSGCIPRQLGQGVLETRNIAVKIFD
jgi:hypothetical protein